jgi:hypothetical protein
MTENERLQAMMQQNRFPQFHIRECIHGIDCPVCRAERESEDEAKKARIKEYNERCAKYLKEFRENKGLV